MQFQHSNILITGGAGSIGVALAQDLLKLQPHAIRIFDNNEYSLACARAKLGTQQYRYLLGDIRDCNRLQMALDGVNIVYHLAAIKCVDIAAYNPTEVLATNIDGTMNLIKTCLKTKPSHVFFLSTDKAVNPTTLYGYTKVIGERLFLWANQISDVTRFSVIRFGNVRQTKGNVFEIWKNQLDAKQPLSVTDNEATRYFMDIEEATTFLIEAATYASGGEIFVNDMEKFNIADMAKTLSENVEVTGLRIDEKLHEELMTEDERKHAKRFDNKYWIIKKPEL
uniref:Putative polysaccharide biosynthesis protein n=1 Tax=viral metagenome TaxID=1070528 RepID=A0A6M3J5P2_9ZZZZ